MASQIFETYVETRAAKTLGFYAALSKRRGWLKDRVEGQRRQVGLVPEPLS